jgi:WD40 repeat protein
VDGNHLYNFNGHHDTVLGLSLADDGNLVVTGCRDSSLHIWDLLSPPPLENQQHENLAASVCTSPCGMYGVSGGGDSTLKLYDLENTKSIGEIETGGSWVTQVLVFRDSERILVAHQNGSMSLWNGVTRELLVRFEDCESAAVNCIAVSLDSTLIMSGVEDGLVAFWSAKSGARLKTFRTHSTPVVGVGFTHNCMVSASKDGQVFIRDFKTAKVLLTSHTHTDDLLCLAISPNATFFATGSSNKTCHLVDLETGQLRHILRGHRGSVTCVKVLSNSTQCLTGSRDCCLRVWDAEDGSCLAELCTDAPITSCDISWKRDHILYGTMGGWVSSVMYKAKEKVRNLVLRETRASSVASIAASSGSSTPSATDTGRKPKETVQGEENEKTCSEVTTCSELHVNGTEETLVPPSDSNKEGCIESDEARSLSGFVHLEKPKILHEPLSSSLEKVVFLETSEEEGGKMEQSKPTSSVCLIL